MNECWDFEMEYAWYDACDHFDLKTSPNVLSSEVLPWWMRMPKNIHPLGNRGWFTDSYPMLHPYYPIENVDPNWIGAFDPFLHDGYWWG